MWGCSGCYTPYGNFWTIAGRSLDCATAADIGDTADLLVFFWLGVGDRLYTARRWWISWQAHSITKARLLASGLGLVMIASSAMRRDWLDRLCNNEMCI